jgi:hypothetical protein
MDFQMMITTIASRLMDAACLLVLSLTSALGATGDDAESKVLSAPQARDHVGETRTVEMTVRASKNSPSHREYYLDSEKDFHDEKNLAIVISYDDAGKFKDAGIDDPAEHYRGKTIQVTGKILHEANQTRIRVNDPKQIKLIEEKEKTL